MRYHIKAILWKQIKDTLKNKTILIQFIMFPVMTVIMENAIELQNMPEHFFANLFAIMYVGMAPLTSIAAIIAEEKEKNTLRVLQMSNVKGGEYLLGNLIYIFVICTLGSLVIGLAGGYAGKTLLTFMAIMAAGHLISAVLGAAIGVISKNQMSATSLTVPVMMVFSFLPMLSMFNETIAKVAKVIYSQQLHLLLQDIQHPELSVQCMTVLSVNALVILAIFIFAYRKVFAISR
nr:ABC transporter permease [Lachnospiraceae bacterium]